MYDTIKVVIIMLKLMVNDREIELSELNSTLVIEYCQKNVVPIIDDTIQIDSLDSVSKRKLLEKIVDLEANRISVLFGDRQVPGYNELFESYRSKLNILRYLESNNNLAPEKAVEMLSTLLLETEDFQEAAKNSTITFE